MRAVVQRVSEASVEIDTGRCANIGKGLLVYLGVQCEDGQSDVDYVVDKVRHLRIFPDDEERMNLDVGQVDGAVLVVSAFTVQADARRGRRPTLEAAAEPDRANELYESFCNALERTGLAVAKGSFRSTMDVKSTNAGPICILLDSRKAF